MVCTNCDILKDRISNLELMIATLEQEARQLHARNVRLQGEVERLERHANTSYNQIKESFSR